MAFLQDRFKYLFGSTKGLILVAIAMISIETAIWGMLSGPMAEMGVREVVVRMLGMKLVQAEREAASSSSTTPLPWLLLAIRERYMILGLLKGQAFL